MRWRSASRSWSGKKAAVEAELIRLRKSWSDLEAELVRLHRQQAAGAGIVAGGDVSRPASA